MTAKTGPSTITVELDVSVYGSHAIIPMAVDHNGEKFIGGFTGAESLVCIRSKETGKTMLVSWPDLIDAAVRAGIDKP